MSAADTSQLVTDTAPRGPLIGPKIGATIVVVGAVLAALVAPALTLRLQNSFDSLAAQPTPAAVRVVDATPRSAIPCAQQTWPYIDAHCLKQGGNKIVAAPEPAPAATGPKPEVVKAEAVQSPKLEAPQKAEAAPQMPASAPVVALDDAKSDMTPVVANVPLPLPRPTAADEDDEYLPAPPAERRQARARRYYSSSPGERLVRNINRVIPFGILRF